MNRSTAQDDTLPAFWYRRSTNPDFLSLQSMYYYAYTYLGLGAAESDTEMRELLDLSTPERS